MSRILVIDEQEIFRVPMAAWFRQEGYDAAAAANGTEAIGHLRGSKVDLILVDVAMRTEDGFALLTRLRNDKRWRSIPIIILTTIAEKQQVITAARLGIRDYILKSQLSLEEMQARIKRLLALRGDEAGARIDPSARAAAAIGKSAAATSGDDIKSLPKLLTRAQCVDRAKAALEPIGLPGVIAQVMTLAATPRRDAAQLSDLIVRDPRLNARVLRAADSPFYSAGAGPVATIPQAVEKIGVSAVRNIASALGIFDAMPAPDESGFNPIRCWQHSLAVAKICEQLFGDDDDVPPGIPYLVGICHDLGEIMFQTAFGPEFTQVLSAATRIDKPIAEIELAMLGITHGELAQLIFESMDLPESIRKPIELMHNVVAGQSRTRLASAVRLADMYANGLLMSSSGRELIVAITQAECTGITGSAHPLLPDAAKLCSEIFAMTAMLARSTAADEEQFMEPIFARIERPVLLVRDPGLSQYDPIAAAATALADTTVVDKLPDAPPADALLVVVARSADSPGFTADRIAKVADPSRTLWLIRKPDSSAKSQPAEGSKPPQSNSALRPVIMPIPIDTLANFIRSTPAQENNPASAAA